MKWSITLLFALLLCSCATSQHIAPRFDQPTTAVIADANKKAVQHIQQATQQATQIEKQFPLAAPMVFALSRSLDDARNELGVSEGARIQLQSQLKTQTDKANDLARNYDNSALSITALKTSRHRWVNYFWMSTGLLTAALVWIFRKPLLLLATGL